MQARHIQPTSSINPNQAYQSYHYAPYPVLATREVLTLSLPLHWLSAVLYCDTSALDDAEASAFARWLRDTKRDLGHGKPVAVGCINTDQYFARYHDAAEYGVLPCMCVDVDLIVE